MKILFFTRISCICITLFFLVGCSSSKLNDSSVKGFINRINQIELEEELTQFFSDGEFTLDEIETIPFERNTEGELIKATRFNINRQVNEKFEELNKRDKQEVMINVIGSLNLSSTRAIECGREIEHICFFSRIQLKSQDNIYLMKLDKRGKERGMEIIIGD